MATRITAAQARKLGVKVPKAKRQRSSIEDELAAQLDAEGFAYEREYRAIPGRRWRWDFMIPAFATDPKRPFSSFLIVLVEVQGGIWTRSGHTTGTGITRDCEKLNEAVCAGCRVLHVTAEHVRNGKALEWIRRAIA